jgi:glyoxylase-like metal-dependent hydrolase (beta-lactamase superfamily II)
MAKADNHLPLDVAVYDAPTRQWFTAMGYDISGGFLTAIPHRGCDVAAHMLAPAGATRILNEGDVVDTGDRAFEVLHLPGHSPGSIGLWEKATRTLFSGDAIYDGPLLDEIPGADIAVYVKTMKRLRDMPVEIVHAGHDPSFGRTRLIELVDAYLQRRG